MVFYSSSILSSWVLQKLVLYLVFSHQERVRKKQQELCFFSSSSSGCFQLPSNRRKYLLLKNEKIIFFPWLYSSGVIWLVLKALVWGKDSIREKRKTGGMSPKSAPKSRATHQTAHKQLVCFCYSPAVRKETERVYNDSKSLEFMQGIKVLVCHCCPETDNRPAKLPAGRYIISVLFFCSWDSYRTSVSIRTVI